MSRQSEFGKVWSIEIKSSGSHWVIGEKDYESRPQGVLVDSFRDRQECLTLAALPRQITLYEGGNHVARIILKQQQSFDVQLATGFYVAVCWDQPQGSSFHEQADVALANLSTCEAHGYGQALH